MITLHFNRLRQTHGGMTGGTGNITLVKEDVFFQNNANSVTVTGIQSGDFVLVVHTADSGATAWSTQFQGGTGVLGLDSGVGPDTVVGYYFATGTSLTISPNRPIEMISYVVLRGVDTSNPINASAFVEDAAGNIAPNPPAITTTSDNCFIFVGVTIDDTSITSATFDSTYTLLHKLHGGLGEPCHYMIYKTQSSAGTENPAQFGNYPTVPSNDDHHSFTIAIKPA